MKVLSGIAKYLAGVREMGGERETPMLLSLTFELKIPSAIKGYAVG